MWFDFLIWWLKWGLEVSRVEILLVPREGNCTFTELYFY